MIRNQFYNIGANRTMYQSYAAEKDKLKPNPSETSIFSKPIGFQNLSMINVGYDKYMLNSRNDDMKPNPQQFYPSIYPLTPVLKYEQLPIIPSNNIYENPYYRGTTNRPYTIINQ